VLSTKTGRGIKNKYKLKHTKNRESKEEKLRKHTQAEEIHGYAKFFKLRRFTNPLKFMNPLFKSIQLFISPCVSQVAQILLFLVITFTRNQACSFDLPA